MNEKAKPIEAVGDQSMGSCFYIVLKAPSRNYYTQFSLFSSRKTPVALAGVREHAVHGDTDNRKTLVLKEAPASWRQVGKGMQTRSATGLVWPCVLAR